MESEQLAHSSDRTAYELHRWGNEGGALPVGHSPRGHRPKLRSRIRIQPAVSEKGDPTRDIRAIMTDEFKEAFRLAVTDEDHFLARVNSWRARKPALLKNRVKPHAMEYRVEWSQARRRFDTFRGGVPTASFSPMKRIAVDLAVLEAKSETRRTGTKIIVTSTRDGRQILEWDGREPT